MSYSIVSVKPRVLSFAENIDNNSIALLISETEIHFNMLHIFTGKIDTKKRYRYKLQHG